MEGTKSKCAQSVADYYAAYRSDKPKQHLTVGAFEFNIDVGYRIVDTIGKGAYGVVVSGANTQQNAQRPIAIKKIEKAFEDRLYTKRTLRELKLLRLMSHENIIGLDTIMLPKSREEFDDIYCVNQLMQTDLRQLIKVQNKELPLDHTKYFMYQSLRGLAYMHGRGIIHRDMKTRNILVDQDLKLKICDFGLARQVSVNDRTNDLTDYVITRWYRPPELLLENHHYTAAVDIWSMGIIFTEMLTGKCILPGQSSAEQLKMIFELIGTPTEEEIKTIPYPEYQEYVRKMRKREAKDFKRLFPQASDEALDLLHQMLLFDFNHRITAAAALEHPFFSDIHMPEERPDQAQPIPDIEFEFEQYPRLTRQQYKDLVYEEILLYHYPDFRRQYEEKIARGESVCQHIVGNENRNQIDQGEFNDD